MAAIMVLCLALVIGVACGGGKAQEEEEGVKEVKFGAGLGLAGLFGSVIGMPAKRGLELAREKIGVFTVAGQQYPIKTILEENYFTTAGGVASATKLIYEDGVKFMGQSGADAARAAQPLCESAGVLLDGAAGLGFLGPDHPHSICTAPSYETPLAAFFRYLAQAHPEIKTVAIVQEDDLTGHGTAEAAALPSAISTSLMSFVER